MVTGAGSPYHLIKVGARLHPLETIIAYGVTALYFKCDELKPLFLKNLFAQLAIFLPLVQLPCLLKSRMSYVDIGWPSGLVALAVVAMTQGKGTRLRRALCGGCLFLHGLRMAAGALLMFFPYSFKEDLPRYQYAKVRFEEQDGMSPRLWWLKMQHDTLQQAFFNSVLCAAPVLLTAENQAPSLHPLEVGGAVMWAVSWLFENAADGQKDAFVRACKKKRHTDPSLKVAVLGHPPHNGTKYSLWTMCRHPNYFGEWMCWNSFMVMAIPSLLALKQPTWIKAGFGVTYLMVSRIFYDCLNYWTGSEPAEHFSVQKRPDFKDYQKSTRMFFPFEMPFVDHRRTPGFPGVEGQ